MKSILMTVLGLLILSGCSVVDPQERGIRVTLGKAQEEILNPGAHWAIPLYSSIKLVPVKILKIDIERSEAVTKDTQEMKVNLAVNYQIEPNSVHKIITDFGSEELAIDTVLIPAVHEVLKQSTAKKSAMEVLSKREELKAELDKSLMERMKKYGIEVRDVNIVHLKFSDEFTKSVERKMIAEQEAKQAEYAAEKAKNEAKALVNTARGQADSQKLLISTLTPMILQKIALEKWKGDVPLVVGTGGIPFLNLKDLQNKRPPSE